MQRRILGMQRRRTQRRRMHRRIGIRRIRMPRMQKRKMRKKNEKKSVKNVRKMLVRRTISILRTRRVRPRTQINAFSRVQHSFPHPQLAQADIHKRSFGPMHEVWISLSKSNA